MLEEKDCDLNCSENTYLAKKGTIICAGLELLAWVYPCIYKYDFFSSANLDM